MVLTILILLAVEIGGLLVVYAVLRERVRRGTSAAAQSQELREEVSRLVVELNQTTDRNIALVEDGIARLNELLARADKKIGLLRRESEKHEMGMQVYSRLGEGRSAVEQGAPAGGPPPAKTGRARAAAPKAEEGEATDAREQVVRLARGGFAPSLIAARVGVPLGEVELIISLEQRKGQS
jgi:hypothetical protein